jgi:hypothetical protein
MRLSRPFRAVLLAAPIAFLLVLPGMAPAAKRGAACVNPMIGDAQDDRLTGAGSADRVVGNGGDDVLRGRGSADCLSGGPGDDRIVGGGGRDRIDAGRGDDVVNTRDGIVEQVDCGTGVDRATVDTEDQLTGCERVRRPLRATGNWIDDAEAKAFNLVLDKLSDRVATAGLDWLNGKTGGKLDDANTRMANAQFAYIREQLTRLEAAVADLKTAVLQSQSELWQTTVARTSVNIETAARLLDTILAPTTSPEARAAKAAELLSLVNAKQLEHALPEMRGLMAGGPGVGAGIMNKAYEVVRSRRFVTSAHAVQVRRLFDDYAFIQAKNLWVLTWYWYGTKRFFGKPISMTPRAGDGSVSPAAVERYVAEQGAEIKRQREQLLSRWVVPQDSVLDTRTSYLWNWHDGSYNRQAAGGRRAIAQGTTEWVLSLPPSSDFDVLMAGYTGTPGPWLAARGFTPMPNPRGRRFFWTNAPIGEGRECLRRVLFHCIDWYSAPVGEEREIQADHAIPGPTQNVAANEGHTGLWRTGVNAPDFLTRRG